MAQSISVYWDECQDDQVCIPASGKQHIGLFVALGDLDTSPDIAEHRSYALSLRVISAGL